MHWTGGLMFPERLQLRATASPAGARAARLLYHQRRHPALASTADRGRWLALSHGIGRRCPPPVVGFDELCDLLGVAPVGAAAIQSWLADRLILCLVGIHASVVVKVGPRLDTGLFTEAALLDRLNGTAGPVIVPRVRWYGPWREHLVLATEAIELADSQHDVSVEQAAGTATALSLGFGTVGPLVHGDLSPWNLLRAHDGLALVDWEEGRMASEPLFDLAHYVITRGALRWRERPAEAVSQLTAPGSPGWRHLSALNLDPLTAPDLLRDYLERTRGHAQASSAYRQALLRSLRITAARSPHRPSGLAAAGPEPESTGSTPL